MSDRTTTAASRIAELERERNTARYEVMRLQQHRSELDCTYAGAFGESDGGSHCALENPCQRCTLERERDTLRAQLLDALREVCVYHTTGIHVPADSYRAAYESHIKHCSHCSLLREMEERDKARTNDDAKGGE